MKWDCQKVDYLQSYQIPSYQFISGISWPDGFGLHRSLCRLPPSYARHSCTYPFAWLRSLPGSFLPLTSETPLVRWTWPQTLGRFSKEDSGSEGQCRPWVWRVRTWSALVNKAGRSWGQAVRAGGLGGSQPWRPERMRPVERTAQFPLFVVKFFPSVSRFSVFCNGLSL